MANWPSLSFSEVGNKHIPGSHLVSSANQSGKCILNTAQTQWEKFLLEKLQTVGSR